MVHVTRRSAFRGASLALGAVLAVGAVAVGAPASAAGRPAPPAPSTSTGYGGAVSSVDAEASAVGLEVLRKGGNAADAAVATAAALGVTEPYSAGIGGGGYFVYYDAATGEVTTIDGRETAPAEMPSDAFIIPGSVDSDHPFGVAYPFADAVSSGLSVGVPGTLATWEAALDRFGTESLKEMLKPSILLATRGFTGRRDVRRADGRQRGPVRGVPRHGGAVPAERRPAGGGLDVHEPRPRQDAPRDRPPRHRRVLRGRDRRRDRRHRSGPADDRSDRSARVPRLHDGRRHRRLRGDRAGSDAHRVPRPRRLRHGAVVVGRHHGRRVAEHPRELRPRCRGRAAGAAPLPRGDRPRLRRPRRLRRRPGVRRRADRDPAQPGLRRRPRLRDRSGCRVGQARRARAARRGRLRGGGPRRAAPTPRASRRPTSRSSTSGATRSRTRSRSSRPAGRA